MVKKVDKYIILRERESALNPVYWNPVVQTSKKTAEIYGKVLIKEFRVSFISLYIFNF